MNKFLQAPVIETERLRLRAQTAADFETYLGIWSEPAVFRFTLGAVPAREDAWTRYLRIAGHWAVQGFGTWLIEERATGQIIGDVGIFDYRRNMTPSLEGKLEVGWVLSGAAHGKGFASEGVRAALAWAEKNLERQPTYCIIHPDNEPSHRLAKKLGFRETDRMNYKDHPVVLYRREPGAP